ncbi:DNA-processing protein DprA [Caulobacter soli]|uniref:DNA-processing protein DprA n=1 Tax=Caulobacter soli TaxID=2708539 RepID=UPI0013ECAEBA|nr:DNA-processing protein DprA [Caulobacter soli]
MARHSPSSVALLALMKLQGVGRRKALQVAGGVSPTATWTDYLEMVLERAARERLPASDLRVAWSRAEEQLEQSAEAGIVAFSIYDEGYPAQLKTIPDPPAVLYVKGSTEALHDPRAIAIIGTREPTPFGEEVARRSGRTVAERGVVVISGLAHGCDTLAHEGCLDAKGAGVAVLAHGLEKVYPAANRKLAERLLEFQGCLVSEYPIGMTPMRTAFAERDRIQSGLSRAVFVIETDVKGGTMHTVRFASDQKRQLACVDHPVKWRHEDKTKGNQQLIRERRAAPIADGAALAAFLDQIAALPTVDQQASAKPVQTGFAF